jgi:hypothetical protein
LNFKALGGSDSFSTQSYNDETALYYYTGLKEAGISSDGGVFSKIPDFHGKFQRFFQKGVVREPPTFLATPMAWHSQINVFK